MIEFGIINYIVLIFLLIVSVLDLKTRQIPSIFLTGMVFIVISLNLSGAGFILLSMAFALLLYESNFISGIADVKAIIIIGSLIANPLVFFLFMILTVSVGFIYKVIMKKGFKLKDDCAFLPSIFITYGLLLIAVEVVKII